ncbi:hypothetical protein [Nocardioides aromaticivorans]|uniref:hypothetical protein n=1 Tax=Nocardioides aromaticivorans TaxID=200618 RepID=UPI001A8EA4AD|nr:hypothetical protein [Nocardioides aromaticivorans]
MGDRPRVALLFCLLVLAGAVATAPRADHWSGSWKQALDNGAGGTVFIGPAAAGAACLVYARLRSSAMGDIVLLSRRDWQRWLRPFVTIWVLASLALVLVAVAASSLAAARGAPASPGLYWILVPACGVLAGQTALGVLIGHVTARAWAAPAVVVLVFLLFLWTTVGSAPDFFDTGGATASLGGMTYRAWPPLAIGLAGLALAGTALVLAHPRLFLATPGRRLAAFGVGAAWVSSWWFTHGDAGDRVVPMADPPLTCAGTQPTVCLLADLPLPLDDFVAKVDRQAAALRAIGASLPERFVDTPYGPPADPRDGVVNLQEDEVRRTVDVDRVTDTLVRPASCPADYAEGPPVLAFDVRRQLGRWIQFRAGLLEPTPDDGDYDWLHGDPEVQDAWVRTTYRQLAECRYDEIRKHG